MPPKKSSKKKANSSKSSAAAAGTDSDSDSDMSDSSTFKLLTLTEDNVDLWEKRVADVFYGKGWLSVVAAAKHSVATTVADPKDFPDKARGKAWAMLKCSLNANVSKQVASLKIGDVENLLRKVHQIFYRTSIKTRSRLKKQFAAIKLEQFKTLTDYTTELTNIIEKLADIGYKVDFEDQVEALLDGLPSAYDSVNAVIKMPKATPLTWDEIIFQLEDFADNPKIPGTISRLKHRKGDSAYATSSASQSSQVCRFFSKYGKCKWGGQVQVQAYGAAQGQGQGQRPEQQQQQQHGQGPQVYLLWWRKP